MEPPDRDFWDDPWREPPRKGLLPDVPTTSGIEISAPRLVSLIGRDTLPVLARRSATHEELAASSFTRGALVAAVELDRNEFHAGFACDQEELAPRGAASPVAPPRGRMLERQRIDLRARAALPWMPGRYRVVVLLGATVSNAVETRLTRALGGYEDDAVARFIAARWEKPTLLRAHPAPEFPFPSYTQAPGSPLPPRPAGIALSIELPRALRPGSRVVLRGAARLPIPPGDLASAAGPDEPAALAAIHLLVTGERSTAPRILSMRVPVQPPLVAGDPPLGVLHFAIDLLSLGASWPPGRYFAYAFSRGFLAGPLAFDLPRMEREPWR